MSTGWAGPLESEVPIHWQQKEFTHNTTPAEFPAPNLELVNTWADWAQAREYRMDLDPGGRVLLLSSRHHRRTQRDFELVRTVLSYLDELLPPTTPSGELLQGAEMLLGATRVHDIPPIVLVQAEDRGDYSALVEYIGSRLDGGPDFVQHARPDLGFMHGPTHCAAWEIAPKGVRGWRSDQELVNRMTQCMLEARFGPQPNWLSQGVAWCSELQLFGEAHAFPFREDFEGLDEHRGWETPLRRRFKRGSNEEFELSELVEWRPGSYDAQQAGVSWGLVSFLQLHRPGALASVAADLGVYYDLHEGGADGYRVPLAAQREILEFHAGEHLLSETQRYFQEGRRYQAAEKR